MVSNNRGEWLPNGTVLNFRFNNDMDKIIPVTFTDSRARIDYNITKANERDKGVQITLLETNYLNYPDNGAPFEKHYCNRKEEEINYVNWSKIPTKMKMDVHLIGNSLGIIGSAIFTVWDNRWGTDSKLKPISDGKYDLSIYGPSPECHYPSTLFRGGCISK